MATRASASDVTKIIDTTLTSLSPFIKAANITVNNYLADEDSLDDETLKEIEIWLSAHFVAVRDRRRKSETASGVGQSFDGFASGQGLKATIYGQQAIALDSTGKLNRVAEGELPIITASLGIL